MSAMTMEVRQTIREISQDLSDWSLRLQQAEAAGDDDAFLKIVDEITMFGGKLWWKRHSGVAINLAILTFIGGVCLGVVLVKL